MATTGTVVEDEDDGSTAVFDLEVRAGELLRCHYRIKEARKAGDLLAAAKAEAEYGQLRALFAAKHGAITKQNSGDVMQAGVYYTSKQKLFVVRLEPFPVEAAALERLLYDIDRAVVELGQLKDLAVRQSLGDRLGSLATVVLAEIDQVAKSGAVTAGVPLKVVPAKVDQVAKPGAVTDGVQPQRLPPTKERLALLNEEVQHVHTLHREEVIRQVKLRYLTGLSLGVSLAFVFCLALTSMDRLWPAAGFDALPVAAVAAGAVGAAVSVMMRIGKRAAKWLDADAGSWMVERLGSFRPMIGGILAAFAFFAVRGGLIPLTAPAEGAATAFFVTVAFLTGFSERLAKNLLSSAQKTADGSADEAGGKTAA